jgi:hypothetical protein
MFVGSGEPQRENYCYMFVFTFMFICIHSSQNTDLFMMNDFAGTLPNKQWKMPWGQTFICEVGNHLLKDALAMISFRAIPNFHVFRQLKRIFMLAKEHLWQHRVS